MLMGFLTPGMVQLYGLQHLEQALRVEREMAVPAPRRRLRKALRRLFRGTVRRLTRAIEKPSMRAPALHGCG